MHITWWIVNWMYIGKLRWKQINWKVQGLLFIFFLDRWISLFLLGRQSHNSFQRKEKWQLQETAYRWTASRLKILLVSTSSISWLHEEWQLFLSSCAALWEAWRWLLLTRYVEQNTYSNANSFTRTNPYRRAPLPFMPLFKVATCTHQYLRGLCWYCVLLQFY